MDGSTDTKRRAPASVTQALAKRARVTPQRGSALDAVELTTLLLGECTRNVDIGGDPDRLADALAAQYSPRVAELLFRIAGGLDVDSLSCVTGCDVEDFGDKVFGPGSSSSVDSDEDICKIPGSDSDKNNRSVHHDLDQCVPANIVPAGRMCHETRVRDVICPTAIGSELAPVSGKEYNKDTEIALSRIFDLGKVASVVDPSIAPFDPYHGPSVVCMSGFGELGRFGNQILQYAFLRVYAEKHNIDEVQVPSWVGAGLFGLPDRAVQRAHPAVVETAEAKANSTFTAEFLDYIKASNAGRPVPEVAADALVSASHGSVPQNVDFWGWFQWHTSCYAPYKALIQDVFTPVPALQAHMSQIFESKLRMRGGVRHTVVGLHLRLGDYQNISASSFGYCAPTSWYIELLKEIWSTLENPILFVASDDLDAVLRDFAEYSPVTADMIGLTIPDSMSHLKAGFFPDWWSLTQCDVLAISNSTFSFSAAMVNQRPGARVFRAHYADRMVEVDPWNADPIVHRDMSASGLHSAVDTLKLVYNTQGTSGLVRNVFYELPYQGIRSAIMKTVLWKRAQSAV